MQDSAREFLERSGIKLYMLQQQHAACYSGVWDNLYDCQYDTMEEAKAALRLVQGARGYRYRIAEACPIVEYRPVKGA